MDCKILTGSESVQGSPEWFEYRRTRVMASDASAIMGESIYKTPLQLYNEKINGTEIPVNRAMQRGKDLEPVARDWFNARMAPPFFVPAVVESKLHEGLGASLDGLRIGREIEVLEIKCNGEEFHLEAIAGSVPRTHYAQLQHIMLVTGASYCNYLSFDGNSGVCLRVEANISYQKKLITKELEFLNCLRTKTPPERTEKDPIVVFDPEADKIADEYAETIEKIKVLESIASDLKEKLIGYSKADKTIVGNLLINRIEREGTIDYKAIPEIMNLDLSKYRKEKIVTWRISAIQG
jgi:putative phage-type endonuclease